MLFDDSSNRVKPASVAAFLFMPQFGRMFRSSSHLLPVFIRTIANMFVQADLLPPTHPAALYGAPGVEKYSFVKMLGDAWYTLRSTRATTYQWGIFSSVLLMIFVFFITVASMLFSVSSGFVETASAQQQYIFTSPLGPTDIQNMPGPEGPCTSQTPLCRIVPASGPYSDYAIDLLDKMLRLGANQTGGPLQNATGALMEIYNAGILFIAACMLFWLIISVVVDIARTGQVGGGRHNLVWAPIRIVFALGMMVPLGTSGFSSGQFVVMKFAEWGSNFGSNGWNAYLKKIISNSNIIPELSLGDGLEPLAGSYERMWICKVAHNGYGRESEGDDFTKPNMDQVVELRLESGQVDKGTMSFAYTNATSSDLCGRVTFPTGNDPALEGTLADANADPVAKAEAQYKQSMDIAWMNVFIGSNYHKGMQATDPNSPSDNMDQNVPLAQLAKKFACGFVSQHIWDPDALSLDCNGAMAQCGAGQPGSGQYPDVTSCLDDPNAEQGGTMTGLIQQAIYNAAESGLSQLKSIPPDALFGTHGWADMGSFFKNITTLTGTVKYALAVPVKISAPSIQDTSDNQSAKVQEVLAKFDDWLQTVPNGQAPGQDNKDGSCGDDPPPAGCPKWAHHGWNATNGIVHMAKGAPGAIKKGAVSVYEDAKKTISQIESFAKDPAGLLLGPLKNLESDYQGRKFLGIPDPKDRAHVNDYPIQILANVGVLLMKLATALYIGLTATEMILGIMPNAEGVALASSMLAQLIDILGDVLMGCGFILVYYLPIMPYIRVAHAVLIWMVSVFEAVVLVPIACLSFLDTEKEGMYSKHPFINWLDIVVRPILTVIGYVGAILVFDAFFGYLQASMANAASAEVADTGVINHFLAMFGNTALFVFLAYTAANTSFKMINMIPDAFFRWLPGGQAAAITHEQAPNGAPIMQQMGSMAGKGMGAPGKAMQQERMYGPPGGGGKGGGDRNAPGPGTGPGGKDGKDGPSGKTGDTGGQGSAGDSGSPGSPGQLGGSDNSKNIPKGSDRRLKENIKLMGTDNGFNIYKFNYIGNPQKYVGVMADEVLKINPEAVCEANGYLAVYYDRIGIEFRAIN